MSPKSGYAVLWLEPDGAQYVGKLELLLGVFRLEGRGQGGREVGRTHTYVEVVTITRTRSAGRRATVVELRDATRLVITSVDAPGIATELEHELRRRSEEPHLPSGIAPMTGAA